jgi:hypothetical protein
MNHPWLELDRLTWVAPLGLRFWDPLTEHIVNEGLRVSAVPQVNGVYPGLPMEAQAGPSGVYVFHHLPGLRAAESGRGDAAYWSSPPLRRSFTVSVSDARDRFLPMQFTVQAPVKEIFGWDTLSVPAISPWPRQPAGVVPLFSMPQRPVSRGSAVLRASLILADDSPAPWALLEAYCQGELVARGLADDRGQAALFFAYPPLGDDSPIQQRHPLRQQTWPIELRVFFLQAAPTTNGVPDLDVILSQAECTPLASLSPPVDLSVQTLRFGSDLIVHSLSCSELWII